MTMTTVQAWQCDVCGYQWLKVPGRRPLQCPSRKCRSRSWDSPIPANPDKYKAPKHRLTGHAACDPEYVAPKPLKPVEQAIVDSLPRIEHDVKACRLYGCLMCKMAKA